METFLGIVLILSLIGTVFGIVIGVIASFVEIGKKLAPIVVASVLIMLYYESSDLELNLSDQVNKLTNFIESQQ